MRAMHACIRSTDGIEWMDGWRLPADSTSFTGLPD